MRPGIAAFFVALLAVPIFQVAKDIRTDVVFTFGTGASMRLPSRSLNATGQEN
jgi:hypothetical protein